MLLFLFAQDLNAKSLSILPCPNKDISATYRQLLQSFNLAWKVSDELAAVFLTLMNPIFITQENGRLPRYRTNDVRR